MDLPKPITSGGLSLREALARRRSVREFDPRRLSAEELSQLLWATQGVTSPTGYRTSPSAGGLYPLELYVAVRDGVYHYEPARHILVQKSSRDVRRALYQAALYRVSISQEPVEEAPAVFIISAVYERITAKYGGKRGERYVLMEVGHAAQNLLLEAVSLGLAGVPVGAFSDDEVAGILELPGTERVVYLIPVGYSHSGTGGQV